MKTVRIAMDDDLITEVDSAVRQLGTTRSAFMAQALRETLDRSEMLDHRIREFRRKGVISLPMSNAKGEFKKLMKKPGALRRFLDSRG
jgi:metal-responsive CopG/Arc/MetJ family transcriptional regulator